MSKRNHPVSWSKPDCSPPAGSHGSLPEPAPTANGTCPPRASRSSYFSPSGQLANGIVLTGLFSNQNPANGDREGLHRCTYRDGTVIEYDSIAHHLNATLAEGGTTDLISSGGIHIVGPITHEGDYTQTGNQTITGEVTVSVDVVAANISLVNHPHGNVMPGSAKTGRPE